VLRCVLLVHALLLQTYHTLVLCALTCCPKPGLDRRLHVHPQLLQRQSHQLYSLGMFLSEEIFWKQCEVDNGPEYLNVSVDGQQYRLFKYPLNWDDAQQQCKQHGMRLARMYSRLHASKVHLAVQQISPEPPEYWIGLNDIQTEGRYVWDDGTGGGAHRL